jgi:hypothetical protein
MFVVITVVVIMKLAMEINNITESMTRMTYDKTRKRTIMIKIIETVVRAEIMVTAITG